MKKKLTLCATAHDSHTRKCDFPDCHEEGTCKAPKNRDLTDYYMFCPEHARIYNEHWDYYKDMSPDEIEQHIRNDVGWQRPTWSFSPRMQINDPFNLNKEMGIDITAFEARPHRDPAVIKAMKLLNLAEPLEKTSLKKSYRELAKKYHPDRTKGDKHAEEIFKTISEAYAFLLKNLTDSEK